MKSLEVSPKGVIQSIQTEWGPILAEKIQAARSLIVNSQTQYDAALKEGAALSKTLKEFEKLRKEIVQPLTDAKAFIDAAFKEMAKDGPPAVDELRARAGKWQHEENKRIEAERRRIEEERRAEERRLEEEKQKELARIEAERAEKAKLEAAFGLTGEADKQAVEEKLDVVHGAMDIKNEIAKNAAIQHKVLNNETPKNVRKIWKYRIVDANLLPRMYLMPDASALNAAVKSGARQIPGVEVYEDEQVFFR